MRYHFCVCVCALRAVVMRHLSVRVCMRSQGGDVLPFLCVCMRSQGGGDASSLCACVYALQGQ
jgi:hypothetical protein